MMKLTSVSLPPNTFVAFAHSMKGRKDSSGFLETVVDVMANNRSEKTLEELCSMVKEKCEKNPDIKIYKVVFYSNVYLASRCPGRI